MTNLSALTITEVYALAFELAEERELIKAEMLLGRAA